MSFPAHGPGGPPAIDEPGAVEELGETLRAAGYIGDAVSRALGVEGHGVIRSADTPLHRRRLDGIGPLGAVVALFVLDVPVTRGAVVEAFAPIPLERLVRLGLIELGGDAVRSRVRLVPHDDLLIASDRPPASGGPEQADHVAGVHGPSVTLAHLTVRKPVETALDVGTGCGIQAILAARHSERVLATDVNPRALGFAAFNAQLNGVANVELRPGSFFEPVEGSRFGLVACNPPYVISPESTYLFRDGGLPGDTVSREVVRRAPGFLEEGGFAQLLVSWVDNPGAAWSAPLREWVEGSGCDALLLHDGTQSPLTQAASWTRERFPSDPEGFDAALGRWLEYYERLGIEGIAYGAVVLRRRSGAANWVREHELPPGGPRPAGEHILRLFAAQDFLTGLGDERALLAERFVLAGRSRVEQRVVLSGGAWTVAASTVELDEGLAFAAGIDPVIAELLAGLDGRRTLAEAAGELADRQGADRESAASSAVRVVRGLFELGLVVRA